jgi:DNA-binding response OmpR family regulator
MQTSNKEHQMRIERSCASRNRYTERETTLTFSQEPIPSCMQMRILLAEDNTRLAQFICQQLQLELFTVRVVADGREAQRLALEQAYDLVLLALPGTSGLEVLRWIRSTKPELPVIIVAGSGQVEERVRGLDAGADDYLVKPFALAELAARIRAVLRRIRRPKQGLLRVHDLELDRFLHIVRRSGTLLDLSPKEFAVLEFLMCQPGQPVPRSTIVKQVWKVKFGTKTNVVDVYINYLRRKVDTGYDRRLIRTVHGVGYQIGGLQAHCD